MAKKLSRTDAIRIIDKTTDRDDPYWERVTEGYLNNPDGADEPLPTVADVLGALGVSNNEYESATKERDGRFVVSKATLFDESIIYSVIRKVDKVLVVRAIDEDGAYRIIDALDEYGE